MAESVFQKLERRLRKVAKSDDRKQKRIVELEGRIEKAKLLTWDGRVIRALRGEEESELPETTRAELEARIEGALEMHGNFGGYCENCGSPFPCEEVRILRGEDG